MSASLTLLQERAYHYSPLGFLRGSEHVLAESFLDDLQESETAGGLQRIGTRSRLWLRYLKWDSDYFCCPTYRLEFSDWDADVAAPVESLAHVLTELRSELERRHDSYYLFTELPSEDVVMLQAVGLAGWRLIETRLTYFRNLLERADKEHHPAVMVAKKSDIPNLRKVAMGARNEYDRFHADPFFTKAVADVFLAEYVEQCVRGMTDIVLVPADDTTPPDAFICGSLSDKSIAGIRVGKLVLTAVAKSRKGWYRHLNMALLDWMQTAGMSYCINTTQSTNRAVIHVCEQLGYQYGRASHVFATFKKESL
ncbi:MAG: hypothetical protein U0932_04915 [Thiobacillus sp.]|nr:hypothetical protein [Thiobacillus sp.]